MSFEVKHLADLPDMHAELSEDGFSVIDASETVKAALDAFSRLKTTFSAVALIVGITALASGAALLIRMQAGRTAEFGLRRALGFTRSDIHALCRREALITAVPTALAALGLSAALSILPLPSGQLEPTFAQLAISVVLPVTAFLTISGISTRRLTGISPAKALSSD